MNSTNLDQVFADAKLEINHKIDKFRADLDAGTSDADNFISLSEIEQRWSKLKNETSKTYSDIIATYLCNLDEKAVIKAKKENIGKRGGGKP